MYLHWQMVTIRAVTIGRFTIGIITIAVTIDFGVKKFRLFGHLSVGRLGSLQLKYMLSEVRDYEWNYESIA